MNFNLKHQASYVIGFLVLALIITTAIAWYGVVDTGIKLLIPQIKPLSKYDQYKETIQYKIIFAVILTVVSVIIIDLVRKHAPVANIFGLTGTMRTELPRM